MFKFHLPSTLVSALMALIASVMFAHSETDPIVLSVDHDQIEYHFTLNDMMAFDPVTFSTKTIWSHGTQEFEGVRLKDVLDSIEISDGKMRAVAVDDYAVDIPVSDAVKDGPIIAYLHNGAQMSRRSKGPLRIVYPYDSHKKYQTETVYSRSIWQLNRLFVK